MVDPDLEWREAEIDEKGGVAVAFDEEEQDDEDRKMKRALRLERSLMMMMRSKGMIL